jgi:PEGA domain
MNTYSICKHRWISIVIPAALSCVVSPLFGQNQVMGQVDFHGATNVEKTSGVWIDGGYVGYLKELRGSKKIMLLPGDHEISVRQSGYVDSSQKIIVEPGQTQVVSVRMQKAPGAMAPIVTATLKVNIEPTRAAVFMDDAFVGHAGELGGRHDMRISPGKHRIKIELPGYRTFETEVNLLAGQKSEIKTELVKGSIEQAGPLIKESDKETFNRDH